MSVSNTTAKVQYTGNDSASAFAYTFKVFDQTELKVTKVTISTGAEEVLELTTDYTVSGVGEEAGGNVTLVAGALASTFKLVIELVPPLTQGLDLAENDNLPAEEVEKSLDKGVRVSQYLKQLIDRAVLQPVTATAPLTLPSPSEGKALLWESGALVNSNDDFNDLVTDATAAKTAAEAAQAAAETAQSGAETAETNAAASETAAAASASAASSSQTAAAASASAASSSASAASSSASSAASAQTAAETAQSAAETAQTAAETAKTNAETAETNAETAETNAAASASAASTSETNAGTSETNAAASASAASTSETNAAASAAAAAASAAEAAASGVTELKYNVSLLAFQLAVANSLTQFNLIDGIVDEFNDESGIDTGSSTNESYDATNDLYRASLVETDQASGGTALSGGDAAASSDSVPTMTSNTAPSGVVSANGASSPAWQAFNDNTADSFWQYNAALPHWLKYDFGASNEKVIVKYTINAHSSVPNRTPKDFKLQGSNDDSAWTDLDTQTGQTFSGNETKIYTFSNSTAYRYYRLYITALGSGNEVLVDEMELYASLSKENAFDNDTGTYWASSQTSGSVSGAAYIGYDFGSAKTIRGFSIKQNAADQGITSVKVQRSSNGSDWTDVETVAITANTSEQTYSIDNATSARYWRLLANAETTSGSWQVQEVEFFDSVNNMTLVSADFTAEAQPDTARVVIREQDVDSVTINTDLTVEVSRDGGTTWTAGTLVDEGDYASGVRILAVNGIDISAQPSGTTMKYRIKSLNNKDLKIHGVSLSWGD